MDGGLERCQLACNLHMSAAIENRSCLLLPNDNEFSPFRGLATAKQRTAGFGRLSGDELYNSRGRGTR